MTSHVSQNSDTLSTIPLDGENLIFGGVGDVLWLAHKLAYLLNFSATDSLIINLGARIRIGTDFFSLDCGLYGVEGENGVSASRG